MNDEATQPKSHRTHSYLGIEFVTYKENGWRGSFCFEGRGYFWGGYYTRAQLISIIHKNIEGIHFPEQVNRS